MAAPPTSGSTTPAADEAMSAPAPPRLERYRILERLGAGGMATVWVAHDDELDREVAIKVVRARGSDPEAQARLLREAQAMARVSHPNVVQVFDVGTADGAVYIAMERIHGCTLTEWLASERPGRARIVGAFADVGRALQVVHEQGLVHRDFKPHNAMVGTDGRVRLIDFGLATQPERDGDVAAPYSSSSLDDARVTTGGGSGSLTATGTVMGTPAYMSPEQTQGAPATAASDQFSFCVALFEAVHGHRPFKGDTREALVANIRAGAITISGKPIPRWLDATIRRGLSTQPQARFPSMTEVVARLERGEGRRGWLVPVVATGTLGIAALAFATRRDAAGACAQSAALAEVYGPEQRDAVRDALLRTEIGYADDTWPRVRDYLDQYALSWSSAWTLACDAEMTDAGRDAVSTCLQGGRRALAETVGILAQADAQVLERAGAMVEELPDPELCVAAQSGGAAAIPREHRDAIEALRAELSRAGAQRDAGRVEAATETTAQVLAAARELDLPGFTAEVAMEHARSVEAGADASGASALYEEAFHLASASRGDELAARAAIEVMNTAMDRSEIDRVEQWDRQAQAELSRLGEPPRLRAKYLNERSRLQSKRAEYAQAEASLREALELLARVYGDDDDPRLGAYTDHLGSSLENLGRLEEAVAMHRRALEMFERHSGPNHPETGRTLTNLANATSSLGHREEARDYYQRSYEILHAAYGNEHMDVGSALQGLGTAELALGNLDEAREHLLRAYAIDVANGGANEPRAGVPLNNLGNLEMEAGRVAEAEGYYRRAHDLYQSQLGDNHPWTALALANLARVDSERGETTAAIDKYTGALAALRASVGEDHFYAAMVINNRALQRVKLGMTDGAREDYLRAYEIFARLWGENDPRLGQSIYNLAELAEKLGDRDEARRRLEELDRLWADGAPSEEDAQSAKALRARLDRTRTK